MMMESGRMAMVVGTTIVLLIAGACGALAEGPDPFEPMGECPTPPMAPQGAVRAEIMAMNPDSLVCQHFVTFELLPSGSMPGTNYDEIIGVTGASFGEHFAGQMMTQSDVWDVPTGSARAPLVLEPGPPNENLSVAFYETAHTNLLSGLGPVGFPSFDAVGEGSMAILYDTDQSAVGFDIVGGSQGNAYIDFFRRDGSYIDTYTVSGIYWEAYAFRRTGGTVDIAGLVIYNDDPGGMGIDNVCIGGDGGGGLAPVCDAGGGYWGYEGVPATFDATDSFDPDGAVVGYEWDFGDGGSATGAVVEHTFVEGGYYTVTLCVADDSGYLDCCQTYMMISTTAVEQRSWSWGMIKEQYR